MGMGYSPSKAIIITDTAAHTGRFYKVEALKELSYCCDDF